MPPQTSRASGLPNKTCPCHPMAWAVVSTPGIAVSCALITPLAGLPAAGPGADNSADVIFGAKPLSEITSSTLPASSGISWSRWTAASIRCGWRKTQKGPSGSRARATGSFAFGTMTCSRTWTGSWTRFWRRFGNHKNTPSLTLPHQQGGGSRLWRRPRLYSLRSKSSGVVVPVRTSAKASSASLARTS